MESQTTCVKNFFVYILANMTITAEPEMGVELKPSLPEMDLKARAKASKNTAEELSKHGLDLNPDAEDKDVAAKLALAYAENPDSTSKKATTHKMATLTPASLVLTDNILKEFGQSVVKSAVHVRHLVTNKLLLETENPDPKVRIRALELLGKISDVGLFAEKSEVTITHQSTDDLRKKLKQKLENLVKVEDLPQETVVIDGESLNVDEELGLKDEQTDL